MPLRGQMPPPGYGQSLCKYVFGLCFGLGCACDVVPWGKGCCAVRGCAAPVFVDVVAPWGSGVCRARSILCGLWVWVCAFRFFPFSYRRLSLAPPSLTTGSETTSIKNRPKPTSPKTSKTDKYKIIKKKKNNNDENRYKTRLILFGGTCGSFFYNHLFEYDTIEQVRSRERGRERERD
jgi:hypothetical protein